MNTLKTIYNIFLDMTLVNKIIFSLCFLLTIVFAIPESISMRQLLELLLLIVTFYTLINIKSININLSLLFLALIAFWVIFHTVFISHQPDYSLRELNSQRLRPITLFMLAYILSQHERWKLLLYAFIYGLAAILVTQLITASYQWMVTGSIPFQYTIMGNEKHDISLINNLFYGLVLSFFIYKLMANWHLTEVRKKYLIWFTWYFLLTLLILTQINARNGFIGFIGLTLTVLMLTCYQYFLKLNRSIQVTSITLLATLFIGIMSLSVLTDSRWHGFFNSAKLAFTTDTFKDYKAIGAFPSSAQGMDLDGSAFERVTMIKEGILLTFKYPMGYSVGRATYDTLMKNDYGVGRQQATHSALIDWTLEIGYIGLFLWLCLLSSIFIPAFRNWRRDKSLYDLYTCVIILGFFSRALFDSIVMRTHFFEMFMFILGILAARVPGKLLTRGK